MDGLDSQSAYRTDVFHIHGVHVPARPALIVNPVLAGIDVGTGNRIRFLGSQHRVREAAQGGEIPFRNVRGIAFPAQGADIDRIGRACKQGLHQERSVGNQDGFGERTSLRTVREDITGVRPVSFVHRLCPSSQGLGIGHIHHPDTGQGAGRPFIDVHSPDQHEVAVISATGSRNTQQHRFCRVDSVDVHIPPIQTVDAPLGQRSQGCQGFCGIPSGIHGIGLRLGVFQAERIARLEIFRRVARSSPGKFHADRQGLARSGESRRGERNRPVRGNRHLDETFVMGLPSEYHVETAKILGHVNSFRLIAPACIRPLLVIGYQIRTFSGFIEIGCRIRPEAYGNLRGGNIHGSMRAIGSENKGIVRTRHRIGNGRVNPVRSQAFNLDGRTIQSSVISIPDLDAVHFHIGIAGLCIRIEARTAAIGPVLAIGTESPVPVERRIRVQDKDSLALHGIIKCQFQRTFRVSQGIDFRRAFRRVKLAHLDSRCIFQAILTAIVVREAIHRVLGAALRFNVVEIEVGLAERIVRPIKIVIGQDYFPVPDFGGSIVCLPVLRGKGQGTIVIQYEEEVIGSTPLLPGISLVIAPCRSGRRQQFLLGKFKRICRRSAISWRGRRSHSNPDGGR